MSSGVVAAKTTKSEGRAIDSPVSTLETNRRRLGAASSAARSVPHLLAKLPWGTIAAIAGGIAAWYGLTAAVERMATPHDTFVAAVQLLTSPSSYPDFLATLRRVMVGFVGAVVLGAAIGTIMGATRSGDALLKPWVVAALSIPGPVAIIGFILIMGINERSTMFALVFSVTPYVVNIIRDGVGTVETSLTQMSHVFGLSRAARWRHVYVPQLLPAAFASVRTAFAMSWKLVVVIEAIGASRGIGAQMNRSFRRLDAAEGIAWAATFTLMMWLVEVFVFQTAERRLFRWRTATSK